MRLDVLEHWPREDIPWIVDHILAVPRVSAKHEGGRYLIIREEREPESQEKRETLLEG